MKADIHKLLLNKPMKIMTISFAVIQLAFTASFLLFFRSMQPQMPLFYSMPKGEEQLGTPLFMLFLPGIPLVFFILNFLLSAKVFEKHPEISYMLGIFSILTVIFMLFSFIKIISLVIL